MSDIVEQLRYAEHVTDERVMKVMDAGADEIESLRERLDASQAYAQQLREALGLNIVRNPKYPWKPSSNWDNCPACFEMFDLDKCDHCGAGYDDEYIRVKEHTDTSALEAMIQKAGEVMRDRCRYVSGDAMNYDEMHQRIRALPGVTMDDVKQLK